jgi:Cytochrome P450
MRLKAFSPFFNPKFSSKMLLLHFLSVAQATLLCTASVGGYWIYWELTTGHRRRRLIEKHGCRPAKSVKTRDPILGLDAVFEIFRWGRQHTLLENMPKMFFESGNKTAQFNFLSFIPIVSIEVENVKAVLSQNFKSFSKGSTPKEPDLLIGGGIFLNVGEAWHQSRELLRPSFARSQVADLTMIEKYINMMIEKIPRDSSTIDLSKVFSQLTLSTGLELVFGNSGSESDSDPESARCHVFAEVWNRLMNWIGTEGYTGKFWWWNVILDYFRMNPGFKRDCEILHGK